MSSIAKLFHPVSCLTRVITFIKTHFFVFPFVNFGHFPEILFIITFAILQSCRFAPSIARPTNSPEPSASKLRLIRHFPSIKADYHNSINPGFSNHNEFSQIWNLLIFYSWPRFFIRYDGRARLVLDGNHQTFFHQFPAGHFRGAWQIKIRQGVRSVGFQPVGFYL